MSKNKIFLVVAFLLFINIDLFGQENGQIISKIPILKDALLIQFADLSQPERFVVTTSNGLNWTENFKHLDSIDFYAITYLSDGLKVKGYLLEPKKNGVYPCIIYNRGGNRDFGMLNPVRVGYLGSHFASLGYIVIFSNYRGVDGGEGMEQFGGKEVNDVLNLIPALGQIEKADTARIGMYGWSRGGMMTYIALTKTDKIKAAVVGGAVSDVYDAIRDRPEMETFVLSQLIPDYEQNKDEEIFKRSAIKWAGKFPENVPLLMLHGTSDWRVKPEQSLKLALELEKYRIPYRLIMFEGGDHRISEHKQEVRENVVAWFLRYLKNGDPLPDMEYHGR